MLHKLAGSDGYYKQFVNEKGGNEIELKCLDNYALPFALRKLFGQEITESDRVFYHEGLLAKFIEVPDIRINKNSPFSELCKEI